MSQSYAHETNDPITIVTNLRRFPMKANTILISSLEAPFPKRKSYARQFDPLETFEPYLALRAAVLGGKFKPMEEKGIFIRPEDVENLTAHGKAAGKRMLHPWRVAADRLRRTIREAGLESDFSVVKYETDTPGVWFVKVRYEPPMVKTKGGSRD